MAIFCFGGLQSAGFDCYFSGFDSTLPQLEKGYNVISINVLVINIYYAYIYHYTYTYTHGIETTFNFQGQRILLRYVEPSVFCLVHPIYTYIGLCLHFRHSAYDI